MIKMQEEGNIEIDWEDDLLSINEFEMEAVREEERKLDSWEYDYSEEADKTYIYKQSRFYQYRNCPTCHI